MFRQPAPLAEEPITGGMRMLRKTAYVDRVNDTPNDKGSSYGESTENEDSPIDQSGHVSEFTLF